MTEEDFLKRWSRRKREADAAKPAAPQTKTGEPGAIAPESVISTENAHTPQPEFDPASLPSIESITAVSDVTAFLRTGVPVELTRAALRRVWTSDPAIRNFVGLAENAWDFTDPDAMPGFGPLESSDEVRRMIAQVIERVGETARPPNEGTTRSNLEVSENSVASGAATESEPDSSRSPEINTQPHETGDIAAGKPQSEVLLQSNKEDDAMQRDVPEDVKNTKQSSHRTHGSALPR